MFFADLFQFVIYIAQQLGVLVAVGAQTLVLGAHLRELHNPKLHEREEQLANGARKARLGAHVVVVLSGIFITFETIGAYDILFAPAFVGKWTLLIAAVVLEVLLWRGARRWAVEGALGAVWYAVLIVHIAAPAAGWTELLTLFGLWAASFAALWAGASALMSGTSLHLPKPHVKFVLPKLSVPKVSLPKIPAISLPKIPLPAVSVPKSPPAPAPEFHFAYKQELPPAHEIEPEALPAVIDEPPQRVMKVQEYIEEGLPHIRVMPRTPEEAQVHLAHI